MKVAIQGQAADVKVINELLSPWDIQFTKSDEAEVVIVYKEKPVKHRKTIVIPSESADFIASVRDLRLKVSRKIGGEISVVAGSQTVLTIRPRIRYCYERVVKSTSNNSLPTAIEVDKDLICLTVDVAEEYKKIFREALDAELSPLYRLLTGLPVSYTLVPKQFRNLVIRAHRNREKLTLYDKLPLDALRFVLVRSIEKLSEKRLDRKRQNNKECTCLITHDVETCNGLRRSRVLKKLEEKYDVPSSWYIPAKHYKLDLEIIQTLSNHGEVGAHGNRHDGKLPELSRQKMINELCEARQTLEKIVGGTVKGFRAPLLQCNAKLIRALSEVGYVYDASMPTWEPNHPSVMKPYGIGTVNLMWIGRILEVPLTLPQDHQMLHVLGVTPRQTVKTWLEMMEVVKDIEGICSILVHPDYELADSQNLNVYEQLLNQIASDNQSWITTPSQIIDV